MTRALLFAMLAIGTRAMADPFVDHVVSVAVGTGGGGGDLANVVGPHQTHGVAYDFLRRLANDPTRLKIFGDGRQTRDFVTW